jgi:AcrR family transcriptional regulator
MARAGVEHRHQHQVLGAGGGRGPDQGPVAIVVDRLGAWPAWAREPVDGRDDGRAAGDGRGQGGRVPHVATQGLDRAGQPPGPGGVAGQDPDGASGRRAQARRTREAVLDAAERQFLAGGYAGTTVAGVAREAGVSVETIYKGFGGKPGLVRALYDRGLVGPGAVPAYLRADAVREREPDPAAILREWSAITSEVASTVMPIRLLMREAAATDADMAALVAASDQARLERMADHARFLAGRGHLRQGVTVEEAADVLWTCSSLELYELLVLRRGWSLPRFAAFLADFMIIALLPPAAAAGAQ